MSVLTIIGIGFLINIACIIFIMLYSILETTLLVFFGNRLRVVEEGIIMNKLVQEYKEECEKVPFNVYWSLSDYGLFFPFGYIFYSVKLLSLSFRYGSNTALIFILRTRIKRIREWKVNKAK